MNWHRIFHNFTADWHDIQPTEWEFGARVHGTFYHSDRVFRWVRYAQRQCCWCGYVAVLYEFSEETETAGEQPTI
jgi:hypothetical protein